MIGVLTHHWAKPDKVEEAKTLLDGNGAGPEQGAGIRQSPDPYLAERPDENLDACNVGQQ